MKYWSVSFITLLALLVVNIYCRLPGLEKPLKETGSVTGNIYYHLPGTYASDESKSLTEDFLPVLSRISVLSIHVRDTLTHDSVFHFLTDRLGLSVEYFPLKWNERKYAGVYAGNMFLEPCGPYSNFNYASNDFKAIFFGLNCESARSLTSLAEDLTQRHIEMKQDGSIEVTDTTIIKQNIYFSISSGPIQTRVNEDSLRLVLFRNNEKGPGIERIKEIRVGYTDNQSLGKWENLIRPSVISQSGLWKINEDQNIRFVKSSIREVSAIVFKVKSLEKAKNWLSVNNLTGRIFTDEIALDKSKTFGLFILFSEKE
jgi:hypothetical protein